MMNEKRKPKHFVRLVEFKIDYPTPRVGKIISEPAKPRRKKPKEGGLPPFWY